MQQANPATENATNLLLIDNEKLTAITSEKIIKRGIAYFKENRVTELDWNAQKIWASVEGSDADNPYMVEISLDEDNEILVDCDCPFDWEPVCKHAIAVIMAYRDKNPVFEMEVKNASDKALENRIKRGRSEVVVEQLSGEPWFGKWRARSINTSAYAQNFYTVDIRSLEKRLNFCSCPDFAVNMLGSCKHIEAVLHRVRKEYSKEIADNAGSKQKHSLVCLDWDVNKAPQVRLIRGRDRKLKSVYNRHFNEQGFLEGELPAAFYRFQKSVENYDDVIIGEDVLSHIRLLSEKMAHESKASEIRNKISNLGGRIQGIKAKLYPYQVEGVAFLTSNGRALLADDMGLGKTLQSISAATWLIQNADVRRVLVVCPASLKAQWAREIEKFANLPSTIVQGNAAARSVHYKNHNIFTILNYELVLRDASVINSELAPDLIILDEAQRIKNWKTKSSAAIKSLKSEYAFVLTGTPLENRLEDLYSIMQVVDNRVLGPLWKFMIDFHIMNEKGRVLGYRNLTELRRRIAPVMLRRDRRLVKDQLPDQIRTRYDVRLDDTQRELHDSAMNTAGVLAQILKKRPLTPSEQKRLLASLQSARMACNAAGLVDKTTQGSPKLSELERLLEELCVDNGRKVVVFSQWQQMLQMAENIAQTLGIDYVKLHGGVPSAKRGDLIDKFYNDAAIQIFFSTDAGGVGLNLQNASVVINLDMPWNPAVLEQRIARVHRLGQKEPVQVIQIMSEDSYEENVFLLVTKKRELFNNVISEDANQDVVGLSKKEIELLAEAIDEKQGKDKSKKLDKSPGEGSDKIDTDSLVKTKAKEKSKSATKKSLEETALSEEDKILQLAIEKIQNRLPGRIERIMASGNGLLIVVDNQDSETEKLAEQLPKEVLNTQTEDLPIAFIDAKTFLSLERLKGVPLVDNARLLYQPDDADNVVGQPSLLENVALRKFKAAETLFDQKMYADGLSLLADAMLAKASARAGLTETPPATELAAWLYAEVVPAGFVSDSQAASLMRVFSLRDATTLPEVLVAEVFADAREFVCT